MKPLHILIIPILAASMALTARAEISAIDVDCPGYVSGDVAVPTLSLVRDGSRLSLSMPVVLDSLTLSANRQLTLTPVLRSSASPADTLEFPPVIIDGRNQHILRQRAASTDPEGSIILRRLNGRPQTVDYSASIPAPAWADAGATLSLRRSACGCGRPAGSADGLLAVISAPPAPFVPRLAFITPQASVKTYTLAKQAYIDFPVSRTELHPAYRRNPVELDSIIRTIRLVQADPNISISEINIHGFASPESPYSNNARLAAGRAATLRDYVSSMIPSLPSSAFTSSSTPEDWAGLIERLRAVSLADIPQRDAIIAIAADRSLEPDPREAKIKRLYPEAYRRILADIYPALRHSDYRITYTVRSFTPEEAEAILDTKPGQLSLNELYLVAQRHPASSPRFASVMQTAVTLFPDDPVANLNAAVARLQASDIDGARPYAAKAGSSPEAINLRGAIAYADGDIPLALSLFSSAAQAGLSEAADNAALLRDRLK